MLYNISNSQLRNERKFIFFEPIESIEKLLSFIGAKELYSPRMVNSIYYDTYFHKNFYEAIDGIMRRNKVRVRWYGEENKLIKPLLEVKSKKGSETKKESNKIKELNDLKFLDLKNLEISFFLIGKETIYLGSAFFNL